jgi:hypothetical protein
MDMRMGRRQGSRFPGLPVSHPELAAPPTDDGCLKLSILRSVTD